MVTDAMAATRVAGTLAQVRDERLDLVEAAASLGNIFHGMGLAYSPQINPRQVGLDPCNRVSYGVSAEDVHALTPDIAFVGWSWGEARAAACAEDTQEETPLDAHRELVRATAAVGARRERLDPLRKLGIWSYEHGVALRRGFDAE